MASKQAQKGSRFEYKVRDILREFTGCEWDRSPHSGAGKIKGDLYCANNQYFYCFELKSYADSPIQDNLLTAKSNNIYMWWEQTEREAKQANRKPGLIFKKDRGKTLIAVPEKCYSLNYIKLKTDLIPGDAASLYIYEIEDWMKYVGKEAISI